jgi:hypothetical protein
MESPVPLERRLGGPQSRSERREEDTFLAPTETQTPTPGSSSRSQLLYRLRHSGSYNIGGRVLIINLEETIFHLFWCTLSSSLRGRRIKLGTAWIWSWLLTQTWRGGGGRTDRTYPIVQCSTMIVTRFGLAHISFDIFSRYVPMTERGGGEGSSLSFYILLSYSVCYLQ